MNPRDQHYAPPQHEVASPKRAEQFVECIRTLQNGALVAPDGATKDHALRVRPVALGWLAAKTVQTLSSCLPPKEPEPYDWDGVIAMGSDRDSDATKRTAAATRFRESWNAVLEYETECAARVCEVMRAWAWSTEGASHVRKAGGDNAEKRASEHDDHAQRCRMFLSEQWGIRLAEPPDQHTASKVARRLTRRYDLMPRDVRDWSPE